MSETNPPRKGDVTVIATDALDDLVIEAETLRRILRDLINGMRVAAEMNEGSAHSRYMEKACDVAEARMKKVTP